MKLLVFEVDEEPCGPWIAVYPAWWPKRTIMWVTLNYHQVGKVWFMEPPPPFVWHVIMFYLWSHRLFCIGTDSLPDSTMKCLMSRQLTIIRKKMKDSPALYLPIIHLFFIFFPCDHTTKQLHSGTFVLNRVMFMFRSGGLGNSCFFP